MQNALLQTWEFSVNLKYKSRNIITEIHWCEIQCKILNLDPNANFTN